MRAPAAPAQVEQSRRLGAAALAAILLACATAVVAESPAAGGPAAAPASPAVQPAPAASAASAVTRAPAKTASAGKPNGKQVTTPLWRELKPAEQQALAPLAGSWDTLSLAQKRKWLALSQNFSKLSPDEQAKLHSRMTEWVALSPQQRTLARLNFGVSKQLSPDEKKAKWEAYQALAPEEKRKLAASAPKPPVTAAAIHPVPADKLATVPRGAKPAASAVAPRAIVPPGRLDRNTLLPRAPAAPAAGPAAATRPASAPIAPAASAPKAG
ncbi:DUF3106 domain-containing protein [Ramlibacter sp.]|uniref:DUF3106 domain-containing protein n=1 Tax=Ramlibacter sp. TaxID=1917967 RepID=UPI002D1D0831|nr:DUF3106 domain-containing protein [Ramlibacter sp.]HWI80511.1 DUF3106 domain-containing protein [Ramlibacter sp.]